MATARTDCSHGPYGFGPYVVMAYIVLRSAHPHGEDYGPTREARAGNTNIVMAYVVMAHVVMAI